MRRLKERLVLAFMFHVFAQCFKHLLHFCQMILWLNIYFCRFRIGHHYNSESQKIPTMWFFVIFQYVSCLRLKGEHILGHATYKFHGIISLTADYNNKKLEIWRASNNSSLLTIRISSTSRSGSTKLAGTICKHDFSFILMSLVKYEVSSFELF